MQTNPFSLPQPYEPNDVLTDTYALRCGNISTSMWLEGINESTSPETIARRLAPGLNTHSDESEVHLERWVKRIPKRCRKPRIFSVKLCTFRLGDLRGWE